MERQLEVERSILRRGHPLEVLDIDELDESTVSILLLSRFRSASSVAAEAAADLNLLVFKTTKSSSSSSTSDDEEHSSELVILISTMVPNC